MRLFANSPPFVLPPPRTPELKGCTTFLMDDSRSVHGWRPESLASVVADLFSMPDTASSPSNLTSNGSRSASHPCGDDD
jgi:hypothetical protein